MTAVEREERARAERAKEEKAAKAALAESNKSAYISGAPAPVWGTGGVHALVNEEYGIEDPESPVAVRPESETSSNSKVVAKPTVTKVPLQPKVHPGAGWGPAGWEGLSQSTAKDAPTPPSNTTADATSAALLLLGEQLREERKRTQAAEERNAQLEDEIRSLREKLTEVQDKCMERLERENERAASARLAGNF